MKSLGGVVFLLSIILICPVFVFATDYYVDVTNGDDLNGGLSWGDAKASIGAALGLAGDGDGVHVAEGDYVENLTLEYGEDLWGGYPPGGGSRDPSAYSSVIDGGGIDTVIIIAGDNTVDGFTVTGGVSSLGGGIYCVNASGAVINGNIITMNTATSSAGSAYGGGIYCFNSNLTITSNEITSNTAATSASSAKACGGGLFVDSEISASGNEISSNMAQITASDSQAIGGGIYCKGMSGKIFTENIVAFNQAGTVGNLSNTTVMGGGIYCDSGDSSATFSDNSVTENTAYSYYYAGGNRTFYSYGGGMYIDSGSSPLLSGNTVSSNTAYCYTRTTSQNRTATSYAYGGGLYCAESASPEISGDAISGNTAYAYAYGAEYHSRGNGYAYGGGICFAGSSEPVISSFTNVIDNVSEAHVYTDYSSEGYSYGGGIYCGTDAGLEAEAILISGNVCSGTHSGYWTGGAVYFNQSGSVSFDRCEISENSATYGAGMYATTTDGVFANCFVVLNSSDAFYLQDSSPELTNLTIADNGGTGAKCTGSSSPIITNCIFWDNADDLSNCPQAEYSNIEEGLPDGAGAGNLDPPANPVFIDRPGGDYHLHSHSPCIDRGTDTGAPDHDIDGEARPYAGTVTDIGADETQESNPTVLPTATCSPTATPTFTPTRTITPVDDHYYVDGINGDDANDGLNWESAKASNQAGINLVSGTGTVHAAATTYFENISITSGVTLLGGYPAGGGARDPAVNVTVIDGDHNDCAVRAENGADALIDGFTVTNGDASLGGGIYCLNFDGITISNNVITGNTVSSGSDGVRGGGIYSYNCVITIESNTVTGNIAASSAESGRACGGGIYCGVFDTAVINENGVTENTSDTSGSSAESAGGGLFCEVFSGAMTITGNTVMENTAQTSGSGSKTKAGGFYCSGAGLADIENNQITNNRSQTSGNPNNAEAYGGGVYHAILSDSSSLTENDISGNTAYAYYNSSGSPTNYAYGGGIYLEENSSPSLSSNTAYSYARSNSQNRTANSYAYGGGLYCCEGSSPSFNGDLISFNTAYAYGHCTQYQSTGYAYVYGGGCYFYGSSSPSFSDAATVSDNGAEGRVSSYYSSQAYAYGGGIYAGAGAALSAQNSFITGNYTAGTHASYWYGGGFYFTGSTNVDFDKCDIRENSATTGGGLYLNESEAVFSNCFVVLNADDAFYLYDSSPELMNLTIADNGGTGVECAGTSSPVIVNCIMWDNGDDLIIARRLIRT